MTYYRLRLSAFSNIVEAVNFEGDGYCQSFLASVLLPLHTLERLKPRPCLCCITSVCASIASLSPCCFSCRLWTPLFHWFLWCSIALYFIFIIFWNSITVIASPQFYHSVFAMFARLESRRCCLIIFLFSFHTHQYTYTSNSRYCFFSSSVHLYVMIQVLWCTQCAKS